MAQKLNLQPLELLALGKCQTVSEIVDGMSRCAFGARMLGEVAATLTEEQKTQINERPGIAYMMLLGSGGGMGGGQRGGGGGGGGGARGGGGGGGSQ